MSTVETLRLGALWAIGFLAVRFYGLGALLLLIGAIVLAHAGYWLDEDREDAT